MECQRYTDSIVIFVPDVINADAMMPMSFPMVLLMPASDANS
jgi:hypothetical protein